MYAGTVLLRDYRNYADALLELSPGVNVLYGDNGQGKTNALEALYYCCAGRSHRTRADRELIRAGADAARFRVTAFRRDGEHEIDVRLSRADKRVIRVNGRQISRSGEMMGYMIGVLFSPEDLRTVKDGPEARRRFVDIGLSQLDSGYYYTLQRYNRALRQRNEALRAPGTGTAEIDAWDGQLAKAGWALYCRRDAYIRELGAIASRVAEEIAPGGGEFRCVYAPDIPDAAGEEDVLRALARSRDADLRRGTTTAGVHRDDVKLMLGDMDVRAFGSQGQQRTGALCMRLAELELVKREAGEWPVLMLDDVMSELDPSRRRQLIRRLGEVQTVITCTDLSDLADVRSDRQIRVQDAQFRID